MKEVKEIWKKIDGFDGLYEVSNLGNVRSMKYGNWKILKHTINNRGYYHVCLFKNGKHHTKRIHRLVAETFIPNPDNKPQVNHKDGIKTNNIVDNLEWNTQLENMKHGWINGLYKSGKDHHNSKIIKAIHDDGSVQYFDNGRICADKLGLNYSSLKSSISQGCKLFGYSFQYI